MVLWVFRGIPVLTSPLVVRQPPRSVISAPYVPVISVCLILETQAEAEAEQTFVDAFASGILDAGDEARLAGAYVGARVAEVGRVGRVERLGAELEVKAFGDLEGAIDAEVEVDEAGAAELIPAGGAEARCRNRGVEPEVAGSVDLDF